MSPIRAAVPLARGRIGLPASQMSLFVETARGQGDTWPDRLGGDLARLSPTFPVTVELFLRREQRLTEAEIAESLAAYLTIRRRTELPPECFRLVYVVHLGRIRDLEDGLGVNIDRLLERARVSRRAYERERRWVLLTYACLPPALARITEPRTDPGTGPPPQLPSPLPPLRGDLDDDQELWLGPARIPFTRLGFTARHAQVELTGKIEVAGETWYRIVLSNPTPLTASMDDDIRTASLANAGTEAWVLKGAMSLVVATWEQLLHDIESFEAGSSSRALSERITALRRRTHDRAFADFDQLIGIDDPEGPFKSDLPYLGGAWQLGRDYEAFAPPDGRVVDLQHLLVGLDFFHRQQVLLRAPERELRGVRISSNISPGNSWDASTWAGDVGAAAADATLHMERDGWEREYPKATEAERLRYYFDSRAPDHDLLGDMDALQIDWSRRTYTNATLVELCRRYYEDTYPGGQRLLTRGRRAALEAFLRRRGFTFDAYLPLAEVNLVRQLSSQRAAAERLSRDVATFARFWLVARKATSTTSTASKALLWAGADRPDSDHVGTMTLLFMWWLETAAVENGVQITAN